MQISEHIRVLSVILSERVMRRWECAQFPTVDPMRVRELNTHESIKIREHWSTVFDHISKINMPR